MVLISAIYNSFQLRVRWFVGYTFIKWIDLVIQIWQIIILSICSVKSHDFTSNKVNLFIVSSWSW